MKQAHTDMGVTAAEFDAQVEVLVARLDHFNVAQAEQDELLGLLAPIRDDIVEVESQETGTLAEAAAEALYLAGPDTSGTDRRRSRRACATLRQGADRKLSAAAASSTWVASSAERA